MRVVRRLFLPPSSPAPLRFIIPMKRFNSNSTISRGPQLSFALLLLLPLGFIGCPSSSAPETNDQKSAATSSATPTPALPAFDGQRAFSHVSKMVDMGPRPAGSQELA